MQIIDEINKIVNLCFCKYLNLNLLSHFDVPVGGGSPGVWL
jgi:hypothetical protein